MMGEAWTERQLEAIETRGRNILVSAAAGSGKTTVLVERIRQLIIGEHVGIGEILVATFTNAAASDMKEKIVKALKKAIAGASVSDQKFLKNQFNQVYKANIGTFHSFAIEVIRRYFYVLDIDPDFTICDDAEKAIMQADAVDELFEGKFNSGDEEFIAFLKAYCGAKSENKAKAMVLDLYEKIQALPEPFEWLSEKVEKMSGLDEEMYEYLLPLIMSDVIENLGYAVNAFRSVHHILEKAGVGSLAAKCAKDISAANEVLKSAREGRHGEAAQGIVNMSYETFSAAKDEKAAYAEVKDRIGKVRDRGKASIKEVRDKYFSSDFSMEANAVRATHAHAKTLMRLAEEFDALFKGKKQEQAMLDFNDIEHLALEILKNQDVSSEYREKFKYIFVDEYQDSNLIQEAMVDLIKRDDNVFMVGDVKQSIYKFRLAEPEIFIKKYEAFKNATSGRDVKIDLNTNFRCKGGIISSVNGICEKIMPYDDDSALHKGVSYSGPLEYPVMLNIVEAKEIEDVGADEEINEIQKAELEAGVVARLIKDVAGSTIHEEGKGERGVELKDIVILMRSVKSAGETYYQTLMENGIPAFIEDSGGYFDTIEIEIFMNLLKVIDNMRRDVPLISVLHSRIFGFSPAELSMVRIGSMGTSYYKAFEQYGACGAELGLREKCREAHVKIEGWRRLSQAMPLDELIWKLLLDTGYYEYAGALPAGGQRQANLRALAGKALIYTSARQDALHGFIRYVETLKGKEVQTGQASLISESDNVVRIKTVHKSKGLEFPVVIVSGLGKRFMSGREKSDVCMHKDIGIGLAYYDENERKQRKTLFQHAIESRNKKEGMDEETRILYVALTRAKDRLILVGTAQDAEKTVEKYEFFDPGNRKMTSCFLDMAAPFFIGNQLGHATHSRKEASLHKAKSNAFKENFKSMLTGAEELPVDEKVQEFVNQRLSFEYAGKNALSAKSKYSVSEIGSSEFLPSADKAFAVPLFIQGKKRLTGAEIGAAVHIVMENLDFKKAAQLLEQGRSEGRKYMLSLVGELAEKAVLTQDEAKAIDIGRLEMFIKSDVGKRAAKADAIYKETPFNIVRDINGIETIIQGVIDCYFEEDGEYVLIDYKTGYASGEESIEQVKKMYESQLSLYAEALETVRNVRVKEKYLYLLGRNEAVLL